MDIEKELQAWKEQQLNKNKSYYQRNKEARKEYARRYSANNKEYHREYNKKYYDKNKAYFNEYNKKYRKANKDKKSKLDKQYRQTKVGKIANLKGNYIYCLKIKETIKLKMNNLWRYECLSNLEQTENVYWIYDEDKNKIKWLKRK